MGFTPSVFADGGSGTRNPGAGVEITPPSNKTGIPTDTVSYQFAVKNTGDANDSFTLLAFSQRSWEWNLSSDTVGPLEVNESGVVIVNVTIPAGTPSGTMDNLTFEARSVSETTFARQVVINTTVNPAHVVSIDIEGGYQKTSSIDPPAHRNYTITVRNGGNVNVTITLEHTTPSPGWQLAFDPRYANGNVAIAEGSEGVESVENVNITVSAPDTALPDTSMTLTFWGEKSDEGWTTRDFQDDLTITTIVQPRSGVAFYREQVSGNASFQDTEYNFTMENNGNKDLIVNLEVEKDPILITDLELEQLSLQIGQVPVENVLRVRTAANAALGNYTINLTARDDESGNVVGTTEFYYIIIPELNVTNISVTDSEPIQYKKTTLTATIENTGFVNARNVTVKFYDGDDKIGSKKLDYLNVTETVLVNFKWSPSNFGNRSIRVSLDVEGIGDFKSHGTNIAEKEVNLDIDINWEPYYLILYVIIIIVLGVATISAMLELRYYTGVPHLNNIGNGEEPYDDYPEDELPPGEEEEGEMPFGSYGASATIDSRKEERFPYESPRERAREAPPPERRRERPREHPPERRRESPRKIPPGERRERPPPIEPPHKREIAIPRDPETIRKENEQKDEMTRVRDKLDKLKSFGVDTANIEQLVNTARKSLHEGDFAKSKQYLGYASERMDNLLEKRAEAERAIREAKEVLSGMRGTTDLTIVENFLVKADSLFEEGDYREAINYANKAKERAVRLQRREMRL